MENFRINLLISTICLLTFLMSCAKDSNGLDDSFADQTITIEENPARGTIIGKIKENLQGNYVFTIVSQDPENALDINAATGELIISDELLFNYEIYPELTASIQIANTEGSTMVNLKVTLIDADDMVFFLGSSREAYLQAAYGDWIAITEEEYDLLAARIAGVVKSGTTEAQYQLEGTTSFDTFDATYANFNEYNIPEGHRLFAFKYFSTADEVEGVNIKVSLADVSPAYASLPAVLPPHGKGNQFFVLKGGSDPALRELRLGMYSPKSGLVVIDPTLDSEVLYGVDNSEILNDFPPVLNAVGRYQGLSTEIIQWD
ncbi:cadherin repeat domain-containing protein [Poritiphilus flavus]|uniref:Cadherin domain-containing protein n=1 Tax=Poritiphilus flavus TaxID=2697053 RepID=A0A6L9EEH4_9FLAO|nr:cadherin repeat domain-containing protein [Poritiphilus flavus]NAS13164.1 hypothetical protein [Poritiphilus flavus]